MLFGFLPVFFSVEIALPKRPTAALPWPCVIDGAAFSWLVKDAVIVGLLAQASAFAYLASEELFEGYLLHLHVQSQRRDFHFIDPDVTAATATIATLGALEA